MSAPCRHPLVLVAAVAQNDVIGRAGTLPWHLPGDLARFREITDRHPLLMGRVTFESIGGPLPGRASIVVSRTTAPAIPGVIPASDLATGLAHADAAADALGAPAIMVVGGAAIYAALIDVAHRLLITEVEAAPDGDAVFPAIDPQMWRVGDVEVPPRRPDDSCGYRFVRWERRRTEAAGSNGFGGPRA